jgi:hypothetical protein
MERFHLHKPEVSVAPLAMLNELPSLLSDLKMYLG